MQNLITQNNDGSLTVDSVVVANEFGRSHGKVLRSIDLVNSKLIERGQAAIGSSNYIDSQGKTQRRPLESKTMQENSNQPGQLDGNHSDSDPVRIDLRAYHGEQLKLKHPTTRSKKQ